MKTSLGLLEVSGLALAIDAADAMAKAASVTLAGVESAKGSGWTLIKITGDVASVESAVAAGKALANQYHGLVSSSVLARPVDSLIRQWLPPQPPVPAEPKRIEAEQEAQPAAGAAAGEDAEEDAAPEPAGGLAEEQEPHEEAESAAETAMPPAPEVSCNLCLDPNCPRKKGEARFLCIHAGKRGKA